jgi:hypothetical protein
MGHDALVLKKLPDPKDVILIAHGHTRFHAIRPQDYANAFGRMGSVRTLGFSNKIRLRNTALEQIVTAYATFAEIGIRAGTPSGDYDWSNTFLEQLQRMIEPGTKDWGRLTGVFSCTENDNRISVTQLLLMSVPDDSDERDAIENNDGGADVNDDPNRPRFECSPGSDIRHP